MNNLGYMQDQMFLAHLFGKKMLKGLQMRVIQISSVRF